MSIYSLYIQLAALIVFCIICIGTAISGLVKRKVYHTSGCPPIKFKEEPVKFIMWSLCLLAMSAGCFIGILYTVREIMNNF